LAEKADVALGTLQRMERLNKPMTSRSDTVAKVVLVLEKAGIEFLNSGSPGVRIRASHAAATQRTGKG
jgi:hypothetical protein